MFTTLPGKHVTPASSVCRHEPTSREVLGHSRSLLSVPEHRTFVSTIGPLPCAEDPYNLATEPMIIEYA